MTDETIIWPTGGQSNLVQAAADPISRRINSANVKRLAVGLVVGFIVYHGILHLTYDVDSCKWLLSDGRFEGYRTKWQPFGCMMHSYTKIDTRTCMRYIAYWGGRNNIVFLGDSRIRQMYTEFVKLAATKEPNLPRVAHHDMAFNDYDLKLDANFLWQPMVNESMLAVYRNWLKRDLSDRPTVIVTGSATWAIKSSNGSLDEVALYEGNLTRLMPLLDALSESTVILWVIQAPVVAEKMDKERVMITNDQIDLYNDAARDVLSYSTSKRVHIWSSSSLVAQGYNDDQEDGLHMGTVAVNYNVQILLNMYCNDKMNYNDGTCCNDGEPVTSIQLITCIFFGVCCVSGIALIVYQRWTSNQIRWHLLINAEDMDGENDGKAIPNEPKTFYELAVCLSKFGAIMAYFYICDRTNLFMKENKYFTPMNFLLPITYVFALGLFFTEESRSTLMLHRDQTDEWKGWMQLIILFYHITGASQVLPIYMHIRLLVTSYLFLSGFGHFSYFWNKGDAGFHRLCQVMFRLNLLVVSLCLCMNRPYQFYYFVPLVTYWYVVMYVVMMTVPQITSFSAEANHIQYLYMVLKFVGLFGLVTVFYMSEVFFEKIFSTRPWKALFVTSDDTTKEWWFRWKLDRYSVPAGMLFSFAYHLLKQNHILDDNNHGNLFSRGLSLIATVAAFLGLGLYIGFSFLCRNKFECNEIHSYISFIPIVSYIILRNISGLLRSRYSAYFAWFGKISLELFICQYHIWLAADTYGVLVLIPSYPVLNVIVTSFIFICVSHEVHSLTRTLAKYAIPTDWRYMTRNLVVFLLLLVPIGIKDGMFF